MKRLLERVPVPLRGFVRLASVLAALALVHEALSWLFLALGVGPRLLAPTADPLTALALAVGLVLYPLRLTLVFGALPLLVASLTRAIAALLSSGDEAPAEPAASARPVRPRPAARK